MLIHPSWREQDWGLRSSRPATRERAEPTGPLQRFSLPPGDGARSRRLRGQDRMTAARSWLVSAGLHGRRWRPLSSAAKCWTTPSIWRSGTWPTSSSSPSTRPGATSNPAFGLIGWCCRPPWPNRAIVQSLLRRDQRDLHVGPGGRTALDEGRWDDRTLQPCWPTIARPGATACPRRAGPASWKRTAGSTTTSLRTRTCRAIPRLNCWPPTSWSIRRLAIGRSWIAHAHALGLLMEAYPNKLKWWNGLQQERALSPLAWLIRG